MELNVELLQTYEMQGQCHGGTSRAPISPMVLGMGMPVGTDSRSPRTAYMERTHEVTKTQTTFEDTTPGFDRVLAKVSSYGTDPDADKKRSCY